MIRPVQATRNAANSGGMLGVMEDEVGCVEVEADRRKGFEPVHAEQPVEEQSVDGEAPHSQRNDFEIRDRERTDDRLIEVKDGNRLRLYLTGGCLLHRVGKPAEPEIARDDRGQQGNVGSPGVDDKSIWSSVEPSNNGDQAPVGKCDSWDTIDTRH